MLGITKSSLIVVVIQVLTIFDWVAFGGPISKIIFITVFELAKPALDRQKRSNRKSLDSLRFFSHKATTFELVKPALDHQRRSN
jgi:hypothetical protein